MKNSDPLDRFVQLVLGQTELVNINDEKEALTCKDTTSTNAEAQENSARTQRAPNAQTSLHRRKEADTAGNK